MDSYAVAQLGFVWLAHLLLPDPPPDPSRPAIQPPKASTPAVAEARRLAVRSLLVVFPGALVFMFLNGSTLRHDDGVTRIRTRPSFTLLFSPFAATTRFTGDTA